MWAVESGIRLGLPPTWESRLPLAQQQFPGRATQTTRAETARALNPILPLPARFAARSRPSSKPKRFLQPENAPSLYSWPRQPLVLARSSSPPPASECANEKGGGCSRRKLQTPLSCFSAAPTSTSCLRPSCLQPIGY